MLENFLSFIVILCSIAGITLNLVYIEDTGITTVMLVFNIFSVLSMYVLSLVNNFTPIRRLPQFIFLWRAIQLIIIIATKDYSWTLFAIYIALDVFTYIILILSFKFTSVIDKPIDNFNKVKLGGEDND